MKPMLLLLLSIFVTSQIAIGIRPSEAQDKKNRVRSEKAKTAASGAMPKLEHSKPTLRVDWRLLWFDSERVIKKVRVKMYRYGGWFHPAVDVEVDSDDPFVLKNFTEGLTHAMTFTPREPPSGGIGSEPIGELEVITNQDFFKIYFDTKFILSEKHWQEDNCFVCWTLTKAIDDLLWEKAQRHFPEDQFEYFSGERWLKAERENYAKRVKEAKGN